MTTKRHLPGASALLLCLAALAPGVHAQQDKITYKDGKEKSAKVQSEDFDGLKLSVEGGSTTVPWKDVDSIRYGNAAKYQEAIDAFDAGPAQAAPLLEALTADDKLRPVLRHNVLYHLGQAQKRLGDDVKAIASFESMLKDFPKSRYLIPAGTSLLELYVAKGDPAGASKSLDATLKAAGGAAGQQAGFDFLRGRVLEEQKKYADAERAFQGVSTSAGSTDPSLALAAKVALARCAQRAGRASEAQTKYREIVALEAPNDVLAGAWNGLGEMALADGTSKRSQDDLRYALFAFLRGVVLYVPERGGSTEEYERALAGASKAFKALGELDSDATRKKSFLARAAQRREQLQTEFPRSRYIKE